MFLTISSFGMGNGYEAVMETSSLLASGPLQKVTVLHQLFWFTFRKNISIDSKISAMISNNYSKKNPQ